MSSPGEGHTEKYDLDRCAKLAARNDRAGGGEASVGRLDHFGKSLKARTVTGGDFPCEVGWDTVRYFRERIVTEKG